MALVLRRLGISVWRRVRKRCPRENGVIEQRPRGGRAYWAAEAAGPAAGGAAGKASVVEVHGRGFPACAGRAGLAEAVGLVVRMSGGSAGGCVALVASLRVRWPALARGLRGRGAQCRAQYEQGLKGASETGCMRVHSGLHGVGRCHRGGVTDAGRFSCPNAAISAQPGPRPQAGWYAGRSASR